MTTPAPRRTRPLAAGHVLVVMVVALLGGALLNAQAILRTAEQQELGASRTLALAFAEPLAAVSEALRLDSPRAAIDEVLGRQAPRRDVTVAPPTTTTTGSDASPTATTTTGPDPSATPTTTTTIPAPREVTASQPLQLMIVGDSFAELFGPALVNRGADTGVVEAVVDFRFISGLSRPDYFDWPAYLRGELPTKDVEAAVVIFGGNDAQDVAVGGERFDVGTQAWIDLYSVRVAELMDVLLAHTERVYWVGLPIMESERFTANAVMMNGVYEAEAAERPAVTYISSFELFQDENGRYNAYLDGKHMRYSDGAHFTWNGGYRLADAVLQIIAGDWGFAVP